MPAGSKLCLIRRISAILAGSSSSQEVARLGAAKTVLPGYRTAEFHRDREDLGEQLLTDVCVRAENPDMHVAVAGMTAAQGVSAGADRQLARRGEELRHRRTGHDDVDDVVHAHRLRRPEHFLPRLDQPAGGTPSST